MPTLLSETAGVLLHAIDALQKSCEHSQQRDFLSSLTRAAQTHANPDAALPQAVPNKIEGSAIWWSAARALAESFQLEPKAASASVTWARQVAEDFASSVGHPPRLVYHYTSLRGLKGILKKRCVRATHFEYLNDPDEVHYSRGIFGDDARRTSPGHPDPSLFGEEYIASFSEVGDDLAQWRSYGDGGRGVAIGFLLASEFEMPPHWSVRWAKVEYSEFEQRKLAKGATWEQMVELAPRMKRGMHAFEREWRLVVHTGAFLDTMPPVSFRESKFGLTPYVELKPKGRVDLPIQEIVLGPMAGAKVEYSVGLLLKSRGYFLMEFDEPRTAGVYLRKSTCRAQ